MNFDKLKHHYIFSKSLLAVMLQATMLLCTVSPMGKLWAGITTRVSVTSAGIQGNKFSSTSQISDDGRFVAFVSEANNLVAGDTNNVGDIFVHDRQTHQTTRVSVSSAGVQGNKGSDTPAISADGRWVAFESDANNLVVGDTNIRTDVFLHDRQTRQTIRVSVTSRGFQSFDTIGSGSASISADGRFVAFSSFATNLVTGDTNNEQDIFVYDRLTRQVTRVSVSDTGIEGNSSSSFTSISADGRFVAFSSSASNLVADDTNNSPDAFVHDRQTHQTKRVSISSAGVEGNKDSVAPSISADGRFLAFRSTADNLVPGDTNGLDDINDLGTGDDIFVHDRQTRQTTRVSVSSTGAQVDNNASLSFLPSISADGRFVTFSSDANTLVTGDTNNSNDAFVFDRLTRQTIRVSVNSAGVQGNFDVGRDIISPSISADGRVLAFDSFSTNLIGINADTNNTQDAFVHDRVDNRATAAKADLALTQIVPVTPVRPGGVFSFTATVSNKGTGAAADVALTNVASPNLNAALPTLKPSVGTCSTGQVSVCRLGNLLVGGSAKVTITYTAKKAGAVTNQVSVTALQVDPAPANNRASTTKTINP